MFHGEFAVEIAPELASDADLDHHEVGAGQGATEARVLLNIEEASGCFCHSRNERTDSVQALAVYVHEAQGFYGKVLSATDEAVHELRSVRTASAYYRKLHFDSPPPSKAE
jgi:hypothetical protein